jgi:hypothetical protein
MGSFERAGPAVQEARAGYPGHKAEFKAAQYRKTRAILDYARARYKQKSVRLGLILQPVSRIARYDGQHKMQCARVARHCERSEAIQGPVHRLLDCFVASFLAMTMDY